MIKQAGTVIMGAKTFQTFTRYPKGLEFVIYSRTPETFVNPKPEVITAWATSEDPVVVLKKLAAEGKQEVAICGGASIYSLFLQAGLVDKLYLTVEPVLFGEGVKLFSGEINKKCQLVSQRKLNDNTLLLEYDFVKHAA
jgi:dihydrofolate reductase